MMSQPSVAAYFTARKRPASEELENKAKIRLLSEDENIKFVSPKDQPKAKCEKTRLEFKKDLVSRNLMFDLNSKTIKSSRAKIDKSSKKNFIEDDTQQCLDNLLFKYQQQQETTTTTNKNCSFSKLGNLSPKKRVSKSTNKKYDKSTTKKEKEEDESNLIKKLEICKTPTKKNSTTDSDIENITNISARLKKLRERTSQFRNLDKLKDFSQDEEEEEKKSQQSVDERVRIKEFKRLELEIPTSPQKALLQSPNKFMMSPVKTINLMPSAATLATTTTTTSPARRLLFEPKEEPASPIKASPTKLPTHQRYQKSFKDLELLLPLPRKYSTLLNTFCNVDQVVALLHNRQKINFSTLESAMRKLTRHSFTLDHLKKIKSVWPEAFTFAQEKIIIGGNNNNKDNYQLVVIPNIIVPEEEKKIDRLHLMTPKVINERKRKFFKLLVDRVKDEHDKFLQSFNVPTIIPKDKITMWHPDFDVDSCKDIELAELPKEPTQTKFNSAKDVLEATNEIFSNNTRMQKAIKLLTTTTDQTNTDHQNNTTPKLNSSVVDTPPETPKIQDPYKGIPAGLLERIRARQADKAIKIMTMSRDGQKEAAMHAHLPDIAKILRNIFVSEKKNVLSLEHVVKKLDDSYKRKLSYSHLEEHINMLCKLLNDWIEIIVVRNIKYVKLAKNLNITMILNELEKHADKVK